MRRILIAATAAATLLAAPVAAQTPPSEEQTLLHARLGMMAAAYLLAEEPGIPVPQLVGISVCLVEALRLLPDDLKALLLLQPDFEDALDMAVGAMPALERPLEFCF